MRFKRSTIFMALMLTGSLAAAALVREEEPQANEAVSQAVIKPSHRGDVAEKLSSLPKLKLEKLVRAEVSEPEHDPFAGKSWYVPPPAPPPAPVQQVAPPVPTAPPLPFQYMGRMQEEGGKLIVYLSQGQRAYSVSQGDTLNGTYRLDKVASNHLVMTFLPMNIKQTLKANRVAAAKMHSVPESQNLAPQNPTPGDFVPETGSSTDAEISPQ
ncbi:MAG: hypothetical protein A2342_02335 [Gallionellales bacterium RIFOXYB12_FULL_54_9]|nr:MAG: hypothetical protein A2342_02335 [Gallionellales bacterium RIFOXYB12_FULL_54_9]